jgi:hypothetical protein
VVIAVDITAISYQNSNTGYARPDTKGLIKIRPAKVKVFKAFNSFIPIITKTIISPIAINYNAVNLQNEYDLFVN